MPALGKLYAVGTITSTVVSVRSSSMPRSPSIALHRSAMSGSTTSTVPVAKAVTIASCDSRTTWR